MAMENDTRAAYADCICFAIMTHCANGNSNAAKRLATLFIANNEVDFNLKKYLEIGDYSRAYDLASWLRANAEGM